MRAITIEEMQSKPWGRLTVIGFSGKKGKDKCLLVRCSCGKEFTALIGNVRSGHTKSCGCLSDDSIRERSVTHGMSTTTLYHVYRTMLARCYNKNNEKYNDYGGRGITVCDEWKEHFQSFYNFSMEKGWKKGLQIDRINNDNGYCPDNCRFIQNIANANNKKRLRINNTTGFRGVYSKGKYFVASLSFKGIIRKDFHSFKTAIDAAKLRDKKIVELGIITTMNFPLEEVLSWEETHA